MGFRPSAAGGGKGVPKTQSVFGAPVSEGGNAPRSKIRREPCERQGFSGTASRITVRLKYTTQYRYASIVKWI